MSAMGLCYVRRVTYAVGMWYIPRVTYVVDIHVRHVTYAGGLYYGQNPDFQLFWPNSRLSKI